MSNVEILPDVRPQHCRRLVDPAGDVGRGIHHRVPLPILERLQVVLVAVALEFLEVREEARPRLAAIEKGHLVPPPDGRFDRVRAQECGPAEEEDALRIRPGTRLGSRHPHAGCKQRAGHHPQESASVRHRPGPSKVSGSFPSPLSPNLGASRRHS